MHVKSSVDTHTFTCAHSEQSGELLSRLAKNLWIQTVRTKKRNESLRCIGSSYWTRVLNYLPVSILRLSKKKTAAASPERTCVRHSSNTYGHPLLLAFLGIAQGRRLTRPSLAGNNVRKCSTSELNIRDQRGISTNLLIAVFMFKAPLIDVLYEEWWQVGKYFEWPL